MNNFAEYIEHGWLLVPIPPGQKGPSGAASKGWQKLENCVSDPATALRSAGLAHAYSGTCAIDVDNYPVAAAWLAERGVDLDELFAAPDAVQISSGRTNRGKLLYALSEPLASKKVAKDENKKDALDFRCATAAGFTAQDVLPPSIHPDTGNPYRWVYDDMIVDWRSLPMIPEVLHTIWLSELATSADLTVVPDKGAEVHELRELLTHHDPSMSREEWVRVGMAIHHETDGSAEGLAIWDHWSAGSNKYVGVGDLQNCWRSFHDTPNAVTVGYLRQGTIASPEEFPHVDTATPAEVDPWAKVEQQKRERFKLTPVGEIAAREPPDWLVEGMVPKADLAMMFGAPGSGKSFVALDLAFSVATGFTWFNKKVEKGPVVWIAAEAVGAMRNRARAYGQARGLVLDNTDLWVVEQTLSLMSNEDTTALLQVMKEKQPVLILVDTLAAASGGADENSGADMNKVLDNCRKLHAATGALVMLVHHSGKDASRGARGWSGLHGAVRAEFLLTHAEGSPIRVMKVTKQSDGVEGDKYPFKLLPVPIDFDEDNTSCVVEYLDASLIAESDGSSLGPTQQLVYKVITDIVAEYLDDGEAAPVQRVYDECAAILPPPVAGVRDRRPETVRRAIMGLAAKGYVTITGHLLTLGSAIDENLNA